VRVPESLKIYVCKQRLSLSVYIVSAYIQGLERQTAEMLETHGIVRTARLVAEFRISREMAVRLMEPLRDKGAHFIDTAASGPRGLIYTDTFIDRAKRQLLKVLSAVDRPTPVASLIRPASAVEEGGNARNADMELQDMELELVHGVLSTPYSHTPSKVNLMHSSL
jgi:hypothetical protein